MKYGIDNIEKIFVYYDGLMKLVVTLFVFYVVNQMGGVLTPELTNVFGIMMGFWAIFPSAMAVGDSMTKMALKSKKSTKDAFINIFFIVAILISVILSFLLS